MEKVILVILLGLSALADWKEGRIPNVLCLTGTVIGTICQFYNEGWTGVLYSLKLSVFLFLCLVLLWHGNILGGGDVKLFMMVCFYLPDGIFRFLALAAVCTGLYAFVLMILRRNFFERMSYFLQYVKTCRIDDGWRRYPFDSRRDGERAGVHVSYGIFAAFLIGVLTGQF